MSVLRIVFSLLVFVLAAPAFGQTPTPTPPPDIPMKAVGGIYNIGCVTPSDTDLNQICWARTDLPDEVVELGCMDGPDPDTAYRMDVTIAATPNIDALVKCYATDLGGLASEYSANSGLVDFTLPGQPRIVWNDVIYRTWPRSQQRRLVIEVEAEEVTLFTPRQPQVRQIGTLVLTIAPD